MGIILISKKSTYTNNSFVFPYLIYCSEVWGTTSNIYLEPLIKLLKKMIIIINLPPYNLPTKLIFQELNILPYKRLIFHRIGL